MFGVGFLGFRLHPGIKGRIGNEGRPVISLLTKIERISHFKWPIMVLEDATWLMPALESHSIQMCYNLSDLHLVLNSDPICG